MANVTNLGNVTNIVELLQYDNFIIGGFLGLAFLLVIWTVVFFSTSRSYPFSHAFTTAFFSTLVGSLLLQVIGLISWDATAVSMIGTVIGGLLIYWESPD